MNNLVVDGNLTVGGTTTTVNTETINLADNIITLNSNATGSATQNGGIEVERGDDTNVTLRWNESSDKWEVTEDGSTYKEILLDGDVPDNAATATALETARSIGGVSFDGTADINLPGVNTAGTQNTSGNAATATLAASATALATARTIGGVSFDGTANINLPGVNAAGNQDTSGNAATATALATSRTIALSGDVSGSASFDGTANATITATVANNSHSHTIANVTGLQTALDAAFVSASASNDTITFTTAGGTTSSVSISDAVLSTEQVQDIIGGMVSGNSETNIAVTYNDSTGKLNFSATGTAYTAGTNLSLSGSQFSVVASPTFSGTVTAVNFNATSDERLKENVETIADAGSKVAALRGVNFDWKATGEKTMGVIAQEVEAVIPEVVATDDEGMKSVDYQAMVGLLIEAVKELQEKVDAHEAKCECGK